MWGTKPKYKDLLAKVCFDCWCSGFLNKAEDFKIEMNTWNFRKLALEIRDMKEQLKALQQGLLSLGLLHRESVVAKKLKILLAAKESFWPQRAKTQLLWMMIGELGFLM